MDLLLVNPNSRPIYGNLSPFSASEPPLWCALLAAYAREQGYSVAILDAEVENLNSEETAYRIAEENPLLVAIIAMGQNPPASSTPKMTAVADILEKLPWFVSSNVTRIVAGLHPSALPQQTLEETDTQFVCQGEGFDTIVGLLSLLKVEGASTCWFNVKGLKSVTGLWYWDSNPQFTTNALIDVNQLPMAAWDLLPMQKYRAHNWHCLDKLDQRSPYGVIATSYGCPFSCSYCPIHAMYGGKPNIRFRSPEKVIAEIDFLVENYGIKNFKIMDELFTLWREHTKRICDLLIERNYGLNIWAYARVGLVNPVILRKMKKAGINWIAYGFESANETIRQGVSKKFRQQEMTRTIEMTRAAGINIIANVMFGLPDDSLETMQETLDWAKVCNFEWFNTYVTMPYPGSQLYEEAVRQGAKLPTKWANWGQYSAGLMPLPTKYLSSEEIVAFRDKSFVEYFDRPEYLKMIKGKFGDRAVEHIEEMLRQKIERGK